MQRTLLPLLIWMTFAVSWGIAQHTALPYQDKVDALKSAIESDSQLSSDSTTNKNGISKEYLIGQLDSIVVDLQNPNLYFAAKGRLQNLLGTNRSEVAARALNDLLAAINTRESDSVQATKTQEEAIERMLSTVLVSAKEPKDLDSVIGEISDAEKIDPINNFFLDNTARSRLDAELRLVTNWQNYLQNQGIGNITNAKENLQDVLLLDNGTLGLIPRSLVYDRLTQLIHPKILAPSSASNLQAPVDITNETPMDILLSIKSVDDIPSGIEKLNLLKADTKGNNISSRLDYECGDATKMLVYTKNLCSDLQNGLPPQDKNLYLALHNPPLDVSDGFGLEISPELHTYVQHLFVRSYFDSYTGQDWQPDEPFFKYLSRVIADADSRMDWVLLKKVTDLKHKVFDQILVSSLDFDTLIKAKNEEAASQYTDAVISYRSALDSTDPDLPAEVIGVRLQAIKKDHPNDYSAGIAH